MDSLLDSLFDNSSLEDIGLPNDDAALHNDFEELCHLRALKFPELMLNSTALQQFVRSCVQALNSSAGNGTATAPPASAASEVAIIAIYCLLAAGCMLGNAVVVCVILFNKSMRQSVTNIMVINLAVADFCVGIFSSVQAYMDSGADTQERAFSNAPVLCKFQQVLQVSVLTGTVCILLIICVDRYLAIVYPLSQRQHRRKRWYLVMSSAGWLFAGMFALPNVYFYEYSSAGLCQVSANMSDYFLAYYCCSVALLFGLPLLVMSLLYGRVSLRLLSSISQFGVEYTGRGSRGDAEMTTVVTNEPTTETSGGTQTTATEKSPRAKSSPKAAKKQAVANPASARKRTVQMFVTIVAVFFVCKLPKTIYVLLLLTNPSLVSFSSEMDVVVAAIYLLYLMPSACNPAVYFLFSRQFRTGLASLVACRR